MTAKRKPKRNTKADALAAIMAADPEFAAAQSPDALRRSGRVAHWEQEAAAQAIRQTRERWLDILEGWQTALSVDSDVDADIVARALRYVTGEIERLHRKLGIRQSIETRRAKTLERVRRFRERQHDAERDRLARVRAFVEVALKTFVQEQRNDLTAPRPSQRS